ncbi:MAG: helix-hairpin-helix domain-containing protein [Eubacterium sp.]|nr:helix-hairpin-helix domain-containing protein [Eubacterium sp.]
MKTDLITIPYVGKQTKGALMNIGITCVEDLRGKDPEDLYIKDCLVKGFQEDKCQLYLFRMAVYYAENTEWEAEKLKWWYWKDKEYSEK